MIDSPSTVNARRFDLVICDIDGCLSPESTAAMDLESLARLAAYNRRARETGAAPSLTLCSGRPQPFAEAMCKILDIGGVGCVCENGAWVYWPDTNRYELDPAITREHLVAVRELSDWITQRFGSPRTDLGHTVGVTQQPGKIASVSLYHPDTAYLKSLMPEIERQVGQAGWPIRVSATWLYINLDLKHVSKGSGLDRLLGTLRTAAASPELFSKARLAGVGDTTSDIPIRERCAFFACPANAQAEIKKLADYCSAFDEPRGVEDILAKIQMG
jgi:hydroxymethylpyrimidine pyrophosphatase-like HAD family hydrolase